MTAIAEPHHPTQTHAEVTRDVLATLETPSRGYYLALFGAVGMFLIGIVTFLVLIKDGLGHAGYQPPIFWSVYITTFVFWVGIGHAGTLISAILFLFRSPWRTAVYRSTEAMTVFAVMTAGLFPIIHIGRQWIFYWLLPYPNQRYLWPNFKSPLIWDVFAISTYFTVSTTFLVVGLIPDIAAVRDKVTGWRKKLYSICSLGWTGSDNQWRHYSRGYLYLAALATPLVLSVHSVVSWDFAMSIVPGWHGTIFAPYFVAGAIYSGIGMVLTLLIPLRKVLKLEHMITEYHFDNLAKLTLLTGSILFYAYAMEYFVAWYSSNTFEQTTFWRSAFGPMWWAGWSMIICNAFVSQLLWFK
jgi:Ni/Fe-hydrogenase subunit HybB-like protein